MAINNVYFSVTGDCQNLGVGSYSLSIDGTSPDYRINFTNPGIPNYYTCNGCYSAGTYVYLTGSTTGFTAYNLTGGTYSIEVWDSDSPNNQQIISISVSSGSCVSIDNVQETTCGLNNGSVSASTSTYYSTLNSFDLYNINGNYISTSTTDPPLNYAAFYSLSAGSYYVIGNDGSGCSGRSESFIVKSSTTTNYSLYTIDNSACALNLGRIYISGLTGIPPFTYQWSNGVTGVDFITGLTAGGYSVTVTDGNGCQITESTIVNTADPLGIIAYTFNPPSCSNNDGEITIYYSGGSAPYNVQCSNGDYQIIFDTEYTFQNLASGLYTFTIVDAGLCTTNGSFTLTQTNGFSVQSVNTTNANCFGNNGKLSVNLLGSAGSYSYEISGSTGIVTNGFTIASSGGYPFDILNLTPDTYNLTISSTTSPCLFYSTYIIGNTTPFTVSTSVTGTTCNKNNGLVEITVSTGYTPNLKFTINSNTINNGQTQTIPTSAATFSNLQSGNYLVTVTDLNGIGCTSTTSFIIPQTSTSVDFLPLIVNGNDISLSIIQGQPPYTIYWSSSTSGYLSQTGTTATGLTAGNYNVTVYDSNNCFKQSETVTIVETTTSSFNSSFNICNTTLGSTPISVPKKISQVFFDGYISAISANTGCDINNAVFTSNVYVNSVLYQDIFYTANTLNEVLNISDNYWYDSIKGVLMSVYGIGDVIVDALNNQIIINTNCNLPNNILAGASILIDLQIDYDIICRFCTASFTNCDNPLDEIVVGIVNSNFSVGDVILYNNQCYQLNSNTPVGLAVINKNVPDFVGPTACPDCLSTIP
jgi:hypothetical protein